MKVETKGKIDDLLDGLMAGNISREDFHKRIDDIYYDEETQIAVVWDIQDVMGLDDELTEEQAFDVLQTVKDQHDCNNGITWDHLNQAISDLKEM